MAQAVTQPKGQTNTIAVFLNKYKSEIARALPRHLTADRLSRVALTEFSKNPKLASCDPRSLFGAVIQCAQLGLEPGGALGHAYLVPFKNSKTNSYGVQFIIGYKGMLDLARRSGQIVSIETHVVYEADTFRVTLGLNPDLVHQPNWQAQDRGEMTFVYAIARLKDGGVQFDVMSRAEIERIRNASQGYKTAIKYKDDNTPWISHFDEMARKTVIRRLFKYLPVSIEMQRAVAYDEGFDAGVSQGNDLVIAGDEQGAIAPPSSATEAVKAILSEAIPNEDSVTEDSSVATEAGAPQSEPASVYTPDDDDKYVVTPPPPPASPKGRTRGLKDALQDERDGLTNSPFAI